MELEAHNPPKAKPKRQIFTGFLKMKTEKPVQEDMSHLPPQQRKRQLEKLKKENDKNIAKEQNDIAALKKVIFVPWFGNYLNKNNPKIGRWPKIHNLSF
jgi:hypothetical protein